MQQRGARAGNQNVSVGHGVGALLYHVEGQLCGQFLFRHADADLRQKAVQRAAGNFARGAVPGDLLRGLDGAQVIDHAGYRHELHSGVLLQALEGLVRDRIRLKSHLLQAFAPGKLPDRIPDRQARHPRFAPDGDLIVRAFDRRLLAEARIRDEKFLSASGQQQEAAVPGIVADKAHVHFFGYKECIQFFFFQISEKLFFVSFAHGLRCSLSKTC